MKPWASAMALSGDPPVADLFWCQVVASNYSESQPLAMNSEEHNYNPHSKL